MFLSLLKLFCKTFSVEGVYVKFGRPLSYEKLQHTGMMCLDPPRLIQHENKTLISTKIETVPKKKVYLAWLLGVV